MTDPIAVTQRAREARKATLGFLIETLGTPCTDGDMPDDRNNALDEMFARFEAETRKDERERCAKVAEIWDTPQAEELARNEGASPRDCKTARIIASSIAAAIRQEGPTPCCEGGPQWGHAWGCPKCPD